MLAGEAHVEHKALCWSVPALTRYFGMNPNPDDGIFILTNHKGCIT